MNCINYYRACLFFLVFLIWQFVVLTFCVSVCLVSFGSAGRDLMDNALIYCWFTWDSCWDFSSVCCWDWQPFVHDCLGSSRFLGDCWPLCVVWWVRRVYVIVEYPAHVHVKLDHERSCALLRRLWVVHRPSTGPLDSTAMRHNLSTELVLKELFINKCIRKLYLIQSAQADR